MTEPYRMWILAAPLNKEGVPVMGTFGKSVARVVVMKAETFKALMHDHPSLATAKFDVGEYVDEEEQP